jgi:hypothetical protein
LFSEPQIDFVSGFDLPRTPAGDQPEALLNGHSVNDQQGGLPDKERSRVCRKAF